MHTRTTLCISFILLLLATGFNQLVLGENSTSSDIPEPSHDQDDEGGAGQDSSSSADNSTSANSANATSASEAQDSGSNSTAQEPSEPESDSEQTQNSTSSTSGDETSNPETNQTSTVSDDGQASRNATSSNQNSTNIVQASNQNNTSSFTKQQANSTNVQPANSTYPSNTTETDPQNSISYSSNSTMNENVTSSANESMNLTDSIAAVQNATSLPPQDFDIDIDPLVTSIDAGSSASYTITVSSINGFNSDVSLSITSDSIEGITASLSSNMTRPPANASAMSFLNVQAHPDTQSGKYRLKITGSSANFTDKSVSVKLEVAGQNPDAQAEQDMQFDPVALTPVLIKDMQDSIIDNISSSRMVLISTMVINNYDKTQPFIVVVEIRDKSGTTLYLQLQKGILNPLGEVEVAISWMPDKAGTYQVRTFAIDKLKEDPEPLSAPVGKMVEVK